MNRLSFRCEHRYRAGSELNISFETAHPVTALFGPSGSGKTSVLEMVAGLRVPQQGRIVLGERVLVDTRARRLLPPEERRVGLVFQDHLLFPHLSVEGNLRYGERRRRGAGRTAEFSRVVDVLELQPLLARRPSKLSGGERQRVALGRALLGGPELLLMDEPLTALDEALKLRILSYIERILAEWHIPTLFVSHSRSEVRRLANWVVVLDGGRVVAEGTPDDALSEPAALSL